MPSIKDFEKFAGTTYDYLTLRPRRFYETRAAEPDRYLGHWQFAFEWVAVYMFFAGVVYAAGDASGLWRGIEGGISSDSDLAGENRTAFREAWGILVLLLFFSLSVPFLKFAGWCGRCNVSLAQATVAICYSAALLVVALPYTALAGFLVSFAVSGNWSLAAGPVRVFHDLLQWLALGLMLAYTLPSVAILSSSSVKRLLLGTGLAAAASIAGLVGLLALVALLAPIPA